MTADETIGLVNRKKRPKLGLIGKKTSTLNLTDIEKMKQGKLALYFLILYILK